MTFFKFLTDKYAKESSRTNKSYFKIYPAYPFVNQNKIIKKENYTNTLLKYSALLYFTLLCILLQFIYNKNDYINLKLKLIKYNKRTLAEMSDLHFENQNVSEYRKIKKARSYAYKTWEKICLEETTKRHKNQENRFKIWALICSKNSMSSTWAMDNWKKWCEIINNIFSEIYLSDYEEFLKLINLNITKEMYESFFNYKKKLWEDLNDVMTDTWKEFINYATKEWDNSKTTINLE